MKRSGPADAGIEGQDPMRLDVRGLTWTTSTLTRFRSTVPNAALLPSGENAAACWETGALSGTAAPTCFQASEVVKAHDAE